MWNLTKANGWEDYQKLTDKYSEVMERTLEDKTVTTMEAFEKFEKVLEKVKFKSFGKVTIQKRKPKKVKNSIEDDLENEESEAEILYKEQENYSNGHIRPSHREND